jgi:hypothetical protein
MWLDIADHHVSSTRAQTPSSLEHGVGLTNAGACAEEDAQTSALGAGLFGLNVSEELIRIGPNFAHVPKSPGSVALLESIQRKV